MSRRRLLNDALQNLTKDLSAQSEFDQQISAGRLPIGKPAGTLSSIFLISQ